MSVLSVQRRCWDFGNPVRTFILYSIKRSGKLRTGRCVFFVLNMIPLCIVSSMDASTHDIESLQIRTAVPKYAGTH